MKIDLGKNFIFDLIKGDLKDVPIQEAVAKQVFIAMATKLAEIEREKEEEARQKALKNVLDFDK